MNESLAALSNGLAEVVAAAGARVLRVDGRRRLPASGIAWGDDGVLVTAHHVVERDDGLTVGLPDGRTVAAALVGRDPTTDVAVLRADGGGLAPASWDESPAVGHLVVALGRPGADVEASLGMVSAVGGEWRTPAGGRIDRYVRTEVVMYPGFSGGPLVGAGGAMLGLMTSGVLRGENVAVPPATLRRVVSSLLEHGRVRRGYIGVAGQLARLPGRLAEELGQETGLLVVSVEPDSPAERAGVSMGDTLIAIDGAPIRELGDLLGALSGDRVGSAVTLRVLRGGAVTDLSAVVGERT